MPSRVVLRLLGPEGIMREHFRVGLPTAAACAALGAAGFVATFNLVGQRSSDAATLPIAVA